MSYLSDLTLRLAAAMAELPDDVRARHAAYTAGAQNDDGGFAGRQGPSDPYYTGFALRSLTLLGVLDEHTAARAADFFRSQLERRLSSIDFLSLMISTVLLETAAGIDVFADARRDRQRMLLDSVQPFRRDDGGYAKSPRGGPSSTYHTFLVLACQEMIGVPLQETEKTIELIRSRRRDDGGFVEIPQMRHSGTNPTAAAVGLLRMLGALEEPAQSAAARFLAAMQNQEGGLRANPRIPMADLLSTLTGLVALDDLNSLSQNVLPSPRLRGEGLGVRGLRIGFGATSSIDTAAARRFVESLEQPGGGFHAAAWDDAVDVEYSFYGLGAFALLWPTQR